MKVIARPVGTGKTKELMDAVVEADGMLLTTNKRALAAKAQAYGFDSIDIVDWNDLLYGNYDESKPLFVNKLDDAMVAYFKWAFELELCGYSVATEE